MKKISFVITLLAAAFAVQAQTQVAIKTTADTNAKIKELKVPALDKSPMDMSYFPTDYPVQKSQNKVTTPPVARVIYSRPQKDNRVIFGELVEYDKVWRLGANEATEIEFFKDVTVAGKKLAKGRYTLYAIPSKDKWTIIFNKDTDTWGAFVYDEKKDALRTDVPIVALATPVEAFSMSFSKTEKGMSLQMAWDTISVNLPIDVPVTAQTKGSF